MKTLEEPKSTWGGNWTEKKLLAFEKYVTAYLTIMERNPYWDTVYFDAFAGSGERDIDKTELFKQLSLIEEEELVYKGAAQRIVSLEKKFKWYYFVDKDFSAQKKLNKKLNRIAPDIKERFVFRNEDCNSQLIKLAKASFEKKLASLIFLDPFGMQINWSSIEALRNTRSDVWILIPTGVIINRLLDKRGELKHINKLESFFGMSRDEIENEFYNTRKERTLFGDEIEIIEKVLDPINKIARLYIKNLGEIWRNVTKNPLRLDNSKGCPIFHFVFASNNLNAVRIAQEIIKKI